MMPRLLLVALVTLFASPFTWASPPSSYCYSTTAKPYQLFGAKTAYSSLDHKKLTKAASSVSEKCEPVMVWMIANKGASWPNQGEMTRSFSKLNTIRETVAAGDNYQTLCEKDRKLLEGWQDQIPEGAIGGLHPAGEQGLRSMAQRVKKAFPRVFRKPFSRENYVIQYGKQTWKVTYDSANSFVKGLFPDPPVLEDYVSLEDHVEAMQLCKQKDAQPHQSPDGPVSVSNLQPLQDSYERIRQRLGAPSLQDDDLDSIFFACAQEKAWDPEHKSPFCTLLTPADIKAQEYVDDVQFYYSAAYKDPFSKQLACPLVRDMLQRFQLYAKNPHGQHPKGVFYFGLGKHVNAVTTALGMMYEPTYLGLKTMDPNRKYRTSKFLGFQGNLIAVLNECKSKPAGTRNKYKVKFFLNEAQQKGERLLEKLAEEYGTYTDENTCNYDFCTDDPTERQQYRKDHPYPVGVDPDKKLPEEKSSSSSSSSSDEKKKKKGKGDGEGKKKGHPWYWYIYGFPFMVISTCLTSIWKPFISSSHSFT